MFNIEYPQKMVYVDNNKDIGIQDTKLKSERNFSRKLKKTGYRFRPLWKQDVGMKFQSGLQPNCTQVM